MCCCCQHENNEIKFYNLCAAHMNTFIVFRKHFFFLSSCVVLMLFLNEKERKKKNPFSDLMEFDDKFVLSCWSREENNRTRIKRQREKITEFKQRHYGESLFFMKFILQFPFIMLDIYNRFCFENVSNLSCRIWWLGYYTINDNMFQLLFDSIHSMNGFSFICVLPARFVQNLLLHIFLFYLLLQSNTKATTTTLKHVARFSIYQIYSALNATRNGKLQ